MTQPVEDVVKLAGKIETAVAEYDEAGFDEDRCDIIEAILRTHFTARDAERDAVLRDSRAYVDPYPADEDRKPHRNQLLARIDAIIGKEGEGEALR